MNEHDVLAPASAAEAEMAAVAHRCLVAALDHSKADHIKVILEVADAQAGIDAPVLEIPPRALRFFADVLRQMAKREPMLLMPHKHELTTQDAANFLNVSRPFVVKEIEAGHLKCRPVGAHRRIEFQELRRYMAEQKRRSEGKLQELTSLSEDLPLEF